LEFFFFQGAEQVIYHLFFLEKACDILERVPETELSPEVAQRGVYPSYLCHTLSLFDPGLVGPGQYPWLFPEQWELQCR
jgi:hypothetical protein